MMTPAAAARGNNDGAPCYQAPNYVTPWSSPADNSKTMHDMASMQRRNSMQHVPFMDFSFFPVREETSADPPSLSTAAAIPPAPPLSTDLPVISHHLHGVDVIPMPFSHRQGHPAIPFRRYPLEPPAHTPVEPPSYAHTPIEPPSYEDYLDDRSSPSGSDPSSSSSVNEMPTLASAGVTNAANESSTSLDSSEHSVSSKCTLVSSSEQSSATAVSSSSSSGVEGQRFKPFHEEKWSLRYKELLQFHQCNGHAGVPHTYPKNPQLARWVKRQRRQFKLRSEGKPSTMTQERLELLDSVGFIWDSHDLNWREKLEALTAFRAERGHCNVPSNFRDKKLATWVKCQRRQYKLYWDGKPSAMSLDRIAALEKVGFEWEIRSSSSGASGSSKVAAHSRRVSASRSSVTSTASSVIPLIEESSSSASEEDEPLPVHVPSAMMGTGEQMLLATAIDYL